MWYVGFFVVALVIIAMTHWIYKWKNLTCNGRLPPGSMGLPLIGETFQFFIPSKSFDIHPFLKNRIQKYGPLFKTSLVGQPVVVSSDTDFNHFILQQEGKLVELWYMDSFAKIVGQSGSVKDGSSSTGGYIHKHLKKLVLDQFSPQILKEMLPELEEIASQALCNWTGQACVEVKHACSTMIINFALRQLFGYDPTKSAEFITEDFINFFNGLMSFPINIPGTTYHRCLQKKNRVLKLMRDMIEERRGSPETRKGDFLDQIMDDMKTKSFLTDNSISYIMFGLLLATFETISTTLTLAINLLTEHPLVVQELEKENEEIFRNREIMETTMTWKEYKSMTFTMQVINECLRIGSFVPGFLRRAIKDIHVNGYTIPEGWTIMVVPSAIHLNPLTYKDPLAFNPWRWKDLGANIPAKSFIPFGGGMRLCPGAEFSKVVMVVFLHVLVTKYRWTTVKGGAIVRAPILGFGNDYYIKVSGKPSEGIQK